MLFSAGLFFCVSANAQQQPSFSCAVDDFISIARESDPDFDKKAEEQEKLRRQWTSLISDRQGVLTVPVVVHIVGNHFLNDVTEAQVLSQIEALNIDFMRLNADTVNTPAAFLAVAANPKIQFCLADFDPDGNPTNGINRIKTSKNLYALVSGDTSIWHSSLDGFDGWDPEKYLNIWVANISPAGGIGFWPGAVFPGHREGVVINHTFFGTTGTAAAPYNLGRTATHEIGHYLDLRHLWGDVGNNSNCQASDYCDDTPVQRTASQNCPAFPLTDACTGTAPGLNFMNFMDYPQDNCKNMFTADQVTRMRTCLLGPRASLLSSPACSSPVSQKEESGKPAFTLFPNPATHVLHIGNIAEKTILRIYNVGGQLMLEKEAWEAVSISVDTWAQGIYTLVADTETGRVSYRVIIAN